MLQSVRGTYDIIGEEFQKFHYVNDLFEHFMKLYGYEMIKTPVIEDTAVFKKDNDTSDMVTKEMFTFSINGKDSLTLRPEGTAGVIRAFIQHKLYARELPVKLAYIEEMFRYERPQKGRQRQFNQLGIEVLGDKSPLIDAEVIALGYSFLKTLGIEDMEVHINTLGDSTSRLRYLEALKEYFRPHIDELCADCKDRLEKNPLRILDCKIDHDKDVIKRAPSIYDHLEDEAKSYFKQVLSYLDALEIPYVIDEHMVRGLDYYTDTVFEVVSTDKDAGSQSTIFGGGRYDSLIEEMGGPKMSGIGFAIGEERLISAMESAGLFDDLSITPDVYVIDLTSQDSFALEVAEMLRHNGYATELNYYKRSLKSQFKSADRKKTRFIIIIGEDEVKERKVSLKDKKEETQEMVKIEDLIAKLDVLMEGDRDE